MDLGILQQLIDSKPSRFPPSELFNESWMLRLLLSAMEINPDVNLPFAFPAGTNWYSEASLRSPYPKKDGLTTGEGSTNADALIGDFVKRKKTIAGVQVRKDARRLMVVEAKMGSGLAKGTTYAPVNDQAARSIACLACELSLAGVSPNSIADFGFYLLAPKSRADDFEKLLMPDVLKASMSARFNECRGFVSDGKRLDEWWEHYGNLLVERLSADNVRVVTWEECLEALEPQATRPDGLLRQFYGRCWAGD